MAKTIYNLMTDSVDILKDGRAYPDELSININRFVFTQPSTEYTLTETDVYRFDQVLLDFYGKVDYYLEMVLLLNQIPFLTKDYIGNKIYFPLKEDMDTYYLNYIKNEV